MTIQLTTRLSHAQLMYECAVRGYNMCEERVNACIDAGKITSAMIWLKEMRRWEAEMIGWASK